MGCSYSRPKLMGYEMSYGFTHRGGPCCSCDDDSHRLHGTSMGHSHVQAGFQTQEPGAKIDSTEQVSRMLRAGAAEFLMKPLQQGL